MKSLRGVLSLFAAICLLALWSPPVSADVNLTTSWERPVKFKLVDAESEGPLSQALLILKTEKRTEGSAQPVFFYEVVKGSVTGLAEYRVSEKSPGAEVWVVAPGYALLTKKLLWKDLPGRQIDSSGLETSVPTIPLTVKPLPEASAWQREFRFVIVPELEDLLQLQPPFLSRDEHRTINEFLNRERDRILGL
jgi:hypothetical protein